MDRDTVLGFVRHILTFVGGATGITGVMGEEPTAAAIGAVVTIAGFVWSYIDKKGRKAPAA